MSCVVLEQRSKNALAAAAAKIKGVKSARSGGALMVSLDPTVVNHGMEMAHLAAKQAPVWGYIVSKEDHGYIVNVGLHGVNAFLPFKHVRSGESLHVGSCRFFSVAASVPSASSVTLALPKHLPQTALETVPASGCVAVPCRAVLRSFSPLCLPRVCCVQQIWRRDPHRHVHQARRCRQSVRHQGVSDSVDCELSWV